VNVAMTCSRLPFTFCAATRSVYRKNLAGFEPAALEALQEHPWPGNVRELDHAVERGVCFPAASSFVFLISVCDQIHPVVPPLEDMSLEEVERHLIQRMFDRHQGNVSQAAKALGLSRSAMYRRMQKYGLG